MGLALLAIIWLITFFSTYFFVAKTWWLPHGASTAAQFIDSQFALTYVLMGIVFVAAQGALGLFVWQYRDRAGAKKVEYSHGNTKLEVVWTILTAVLFVGLNLMGSNLLMGFSQVAGQALYLEDLFSFFEIRPEIVPPPNPRPFPVPIREGFAFENVGFRYPGADGKFGATSPKLMDPSAGSESAVGLDTSDPAAKDDVVTGTMYLPVNRQVDLRLRAVDVIHSFFVPNMRFKQDAVPGLEIHMHFTPTEIGDYEIACAELCGLGHYKMHGMLKVVSQEEFDKWLVAREAEKQ